MKPSGGLLMAMLLSTGAFAQTVRGFGSVVFPGGTSATSPNISRNFGSVVFPGGSPSTPPVRGGGTVVAPPVTGRPFNNGFNGGNSFNRGNGFNGGNSFNHGNGFNGSNSFNRGSANRGNRNSNTTIFAYPVYVGGGGGYADPSIGSADSYGPPLQPPPPQANGYYPQAPPQDARPIIIQMPPDPRYTQQPSGMQVYQGGEPAAAPVETDAPDVTHYLIAFKDHSIYSSVAYWFDGDTLHYFTAGDKHNQAPVALIDRELTERLNRESGVDFKLPPAK